MTELTQQRKELINRRDDLAEKHYQLGGAHADVGARNCDCEIAKEYREADRACDEFFAQKKASRSSLESERQAIMKSLSITFDAELGAEGEGYEAPAEPEPQYFATLAEAVEFEFKLVAGEYNRLESENAALTQKVTFHGYGDDPEKLNCGHGRWSVKGDCVTCLSFAIDSINARYSEAVQKMTLSESENERLREALGAKSCGQRFTCVGTGARVYECALPKGHEGECDDHPTRGL